MDSFYDLVQEFIMHLKQCTVWFKHSDYGMGWTIRELSMIIWQRQALFSSKLHVVQLCGPFPLQQIPGALCGDKADGFWRWPHISTWCLFSWCGVLIPYAQGQLSPVFNTTVA